MYDTLLNMVLWKAILVELRRLVSTIIQNLEYRNYCICFLWACAISVRYCGGHVIIHYTLTSRFNINNILRANFTLSPCGLAFFHIMPL